MKKALSLILALVMCLSLCACDVDNNSENSKYGTLIERIEANDYNGAIAEVNKLLGVGENQTQEDGFTENTYLDEDKSVNNDRQTKTIAITAENFETYFELKTTASWQCNAFDEANQLFIQSEFCLKDEYADKVASSFNIAIEVSFTRYRVPLEVNFENRTYTLGKVSAGQEGELITKVISANEGSSTNLVNYSAVAYKLLNKGTINNDSYDNDYYAFEDFSFIRVQGSIEFFDE